MSGKSLYENLQVHPDASPEVIKAAYKSLSTKYHPDRDKSADAARRFAKIQQAFVFLIDASSSMLDGKDQAARRELIASVRRMDQGMELEVIFFTTTITRVFGQFASLKDRANIIDKIANATPVTGGTPVMPALEEAIRMNPDAVFLLTDGSFNEGDISAATRSINSNSIPINTIAFVDRSMESVLKQVASDSGGDYRYVAK